MNERIRELRKRSLEAVPSVSPERAGLLTAFYKRPGVDGLPVPMQRALAFKHILENKTVFIGDGELIVGERGPAPKATPTYPEVCIHSLEDLRVLNDRKKTSFAVDEATRKLFAEEIIPFWKGRSQRERIFAAMDREWTEAYEAGVFTEFMEQRSPGHTALDGKIYTRGMADFRAEIGLALGLLEGKDDPESKARREELEAMSVAAEAMGAFGRRHAARARELAASEKDAARRAELETIAEVCERVPEHAPRNFREALQHYWFIHLGVITEFNTWDAFNPGRLDQHLLPFYERGLADGTLTRDSAGELLQAFWIKFNNQPAPPKVGVTAEESGTYTDFANINLGGLKRDGTDGVNDLSFLLLEVIEEMRILQPSSNIQVSAKGPDRFIRRALDIIRTGFGQPSVFNADAIVKELVRQGKTVEDARDGGASGCVESGAFGKEAYILTGYFNLPKVLELALHNGVDPRTGKRLGPETGEAASFATFDELYAAFEKQMRHFIDIKVRGNDVIEGLYARYLPAPFLSILISDCIANGRDYHAGGARYNTNYIQGVGLGTVTDILSSVRYNVYDGKRLGLGELVRILDADFAGAEDLRRMFLNRTPKFGNDDDYADGLMQRVFESYFAAVDGRPTLRGGRYRINLLPTTVHVYFGRMTGATADGRRAGEPLSEGVSPVQGADRKGPSAVIKSLAKLDHVRTGGTLLNMKFTPQLLVDEAGLTALKDLIRTYFGMSGHHVQFNVVTAEALREAQRHPEKHRDLVVRVAGYSDYFVDCGAELQEEIISRTEHLEF